MRVSIAACCAALSGALVLAMAGTALAAGAAAADPAGDPDPGLRAAPVVPTALLAVPTTPPAPVVGTAVRTPTGAAGTAPVLPVR